MVDISDRQLVDSCPTDSTKEILNRYLRICAYPIEENVNTPMEEKVKDNKLSGIGWNNVDERIKLTFGLGYGTTIYSEVNKGTIVKIVIPKSI